MTIAEKIAEKVEKSQELKKRRISERITYLKELPIKIAEILCTIIRRYVDSDKFHPTDTKEFSFYLNLIKVPTDYNQFELLFIKELNKFDSRSKRKFPFYYSKANVAHWYETIFENKIEIPEELLQPYFQNSQEILDLAAAYVVETLESEGVHYCYIQLDRSTTDRIRKILNITVHLVE